MKKRGMPPRTSITQYGTRKAPAGGTLQTF
ncbi:hypothetical protein E2C01_057127 [Portunus trituberculatus]|uniref:Uncharacterized protein n=1 Tax=Portunus trituberculatus TaxID=210409 RepID=A0A5B7H102_PORTR|nr:hypothetical protein [Portunus trituberculatus]